LSWRWTYWILLAGSGVVTILSTFFFHECYSPAILARKTKRLRKELGRDDLHSKLALRITRKELLKRSLIRPLKLLTRSPVAFLNALYVATNYGTYCVIWCRGMATDKIQVCYISSSPQSPKFSSANTTSRSKFLA
jgi:hypothetical protein